jgi:hypothetical protein
MLTFETKVWENDWEFILKNNYLDKMIANCNFDFDQKTIIINNVKNRAIVEKHCEIKVKEGIIDAFYCVEDYAETVLDFFEIGELPCKNIHKFLFKIFFLKVKKNFNFFFNSKRYMYSIL